MIFPNVVVWGPNCALEKPDAGGSAIRGKVKLRQLESRPSPSRQPKQLFESVLHADISFDKRVQMMRNIFENNGSHKTQASLRLKNEDNTDNSFLLFCLTKWTTLSSSYFEEPSPTASF